MRKKILIVDDSPSVLAILGDMLEGLGYEVAAAIGLPRVKRCQTGLPVARNQSLRPDHYRPDHAGNGRSRFCADRKADAELQVCTDCHALFGGG